MREREREREMEKRKKTRYREKDFISDRRRGEKSHCTFFSDFSLISSELIREKSVKQVQWVFSA